MAIATAMLLADSNAATNCAVDHPEGGWYLDALNMCQMCPPGHACPEGVSVTVSTLSNYMCVPGQYQPLLGQTHCTPCPENTRCPGTGNTAFTPCPPGGSADVGSILCQPCTDPDYFVGPGGVCTPRTPCGPGRYETGRSGFADTTCADVTPYTPTKRLESDGLAPTCVVGGQKRCDGVLEKYIETAETATSDRTFWEWSQCPAGHYVAKPVVADSAGHLIQKQECEPYTDCSSQGMYMVVDGSITEDQDNVCAAPRQCIDKAEYMVSDLHNPPGQVGRDRVCRPYTACAAAPIEYLAVRGNSTSDNVCARVTDCTLPLDAR
jgi:hypothetical protein